MKPVVHIDVAEDVALVTFSMINALDGYDEAAMPCGYRYHLFEGFPGFCDHAGAAGLALYRAFRHVDRDCWLDIVARFADEVIGCAVEQGHPADATTLGRMARAAFWQARRDGFVSLPEARS